MTYPKPIVSIIISLILCLNSFKILSQNVVGRGWRAGVSRVVITPGKPMWMAGYANRDRVSEGKLVDLWAKALILEDNKGKKVVIITADLLGIPRELSNTIRDKLYHEFKLSRSQIVINTSHTHTGPVLTNALINIYPIEGQQQRLVDDYTVKLGEQMIDLVRRAMSVMEPAMVFSGNGVTRFQVNRRNNVEATLALQTQLNGPNDFAVPVLKVTTKEGRLMAVAFGYACHNTVLSGYKYSGDYAGFAQIELEKAYPGAAALFLQGCGANQNPLPRRTIALAKQYGQELSAAVIRVLSEDMRPLMPEISTSYAEISLPLNAAPGKEELGEMVVSLPEAYQKRAAARLLKEMENGHTPITNYPYPVNCWKLGEQTLIALGGEVVIEYAIELKRRLGQDIFVLGYTNDVMAYIPNSVILKEGGYEGASSQMVYGMPSTWKDNIEQLIIEKVLELAKQVGTEGVKEKSNE